MSAPRRFILLFTIALLLTWITLAIVAFGQLPERIPMHFGPSGEADSYSDKSVLSWFGLPLVGVITTLMLLGLARATHRHPTIFNMPAKEQLLDLPVEAQQPFLEQVAIFMSLMATSIVLLFSAIHYDSWRVALGQQQGLSAVTLGAMALSLGGVLFAMPLWMVRFKRGINEAHARANVGTRRSS